jgi:hypothetical protein
MALGSTQPLVKINTRNIPGGKGGRCVRVTTWPPLNADCHENLGTWISWNPLDHTGPVTGLLTECGMTEGKKSFILRLRLLFCLYWDKKKVKRKIVKFDIRRADYILYYLFPSSTVDSSHLSVTVSSASTNSYFDITQLLIIWRCNVSKIIRFRISIFSTIQFNFNWKHFHPTYSFTYNQQDATLYNILCYYQCCTCFGRFLRPSSGAQELYTQHLVRARLAAATASVVGLEQHVPDAVCTIL